MTDGNAGYQVGEVARMSGLTVRTLHHYDEIGLLSPAKRSATGYRRYTEQDLERLHQILAYRALGFPLDEIAELVDDPTVDPVTHLRRQHALVMARIDRLRDQAAAIELMLEAKKMGISLTPAERFEVFGDDDPAAHQPEAEQRWGDTEAYRESQRRAAAYSKADWQRIKTETEELYARIAAAVAAGEPADGGPARALAEEHRQQISRWFYDCPPEFHRGLAEMYVADPRFTASLDRYGPGVAAYLHAAIVANAAGQTG